MGQANHTPAYRTLSPGTLRSRADGLRDRYRACDCCPHACGVDRTVGETGQCGVDDEVIVASAQPHFGEEPPLVGTGGSGTIFLAGCPLSCAFCQNPRISQGLQGDPASPEEIAEKALSLQERGCENVNFVTPTHVPAHLVEAIIIARDRGLSIPIVWNCGGYESVDVLQSLDGIVDIYMPDVKFADPDLAHRYAGVADYPERSRAALREMFRQVGTLDITEGVATRGLLVRHLVLPGRTDNSMDVLQFVAEALSTDTYLNLMGQYRPARDVVGSKQFAEIDRRPTPEEYRRVLNFGRTLDLTRLQADERLLE